MHPKGKGHAPGHLKGGVLAQGVTRNPPETGTWIDEAITKDVTPIDGSACAYFQFRNTTGHFLSKEQAQEMSGIFKDMV